MTRMAKTAPNEFVLILTEFEVQTLGQILEMSKDRRAQLTGRQQRVFNKLLNTTGSVPKSSATIKSPFTWK